MDNGGATSSKCKEKQNILNSFLKHKFLERTASLKYLDVWMSMHVWQGGWGQCWLLQTHGCYRLCLLGYKLIERIQRAASDIHSGIWSKMHLDLHLLCNEGNLKKNKTLVVYSKKHLQLDGPLNVPSNHFSLAKPEFL